jgi:L-asparaginase
LPAPPETIAVFGLGGTIAMTATEAGGAVPSRSAAQLLDTVPGLDRVANSIEIVDFLQRPGASITLRDIVTLAAEIERRLASGRSGAVVVQGTDTIEECAYLLDLLHSRPEPVVVTGAMRNASSAGADGPANLLGAIAVAAAADSRDQGCLVVLADEIHAARWVRKAHTSSVAAFRSEEGGPLGHLVEGIPRFLNRAAGRYVLPYPGEWEPTVGLYTATLGDRGALLEAGADRLDGLIVAGFGVGHVPEWLVPALARLAERIPVVLASRAAAGPTGTSTYGFPGSETDLLSHGLIPAGWLDPFKARILLYAAVAAAADHAMISDAFAAAGTGTGAWPWP